MSRLLYAQMDFTVVEQTTPTPAADLPLSATFYSALNPNWPPLPMNLNSFPAWNLGGNDWLLDDLDYDYQAQARARTEGRFGSRLLDGGAEPDSGTYNIPVYTTNDLWLEITGATNLADNLTSFLTIHTPWDLTNGVWGLYWKTNLAFPGDWIWLMNNLPGETNLTVYNMPVAQGYFRLGPPGSAIRPGFTNNVLAPSDDDFTGAGTVGAELTNLLANLGFMINFCGTTYTNLFVNNNGNVTFGAILSDFTPISLIEQVNDDFASNNVGDIFTPTNIIAPFWADVDTRAEGVVSYGIGVVGGHSAFGVSWSNVGFYVDRGGDASDKTNSFQIVLVQRSERTNGDFDLEFNYSQLQWETGDVSGGDDGLGGESARAGYASANGTNFELTGSAINGAFLDSNITNGLIYTNFNSNVAGRYVFQFHNGVPLSTP